MLTFQFLLGMKHGLPNITYDRNPLYIMFKLLITFCSSSGELVQLI